MQVTATDAKNRFGYYCSQAKLEPVIVEKDGRPDTVMVDYEAYTALRQAASGMSRKANADEFYRRHKDWVDQNNALIEKHGIPLEEYRVW